MGTDMLKDNVIPPRLRGVFKHFYRNYYGADGKIWLAEFKKFLRKEQCWVPVEKEFITVNDWQTSLIQARKIMGRDKVVFARDYNRVWHSDFQGWPINYSKQDLREANAENLEGRDWRLVFCGGLSMDGMRKKLLAAEATQPCFFNQKWYLGRKEAYWFEFSLSPGYYLIDFKERMGDFTHWRQEESFKLVTDTLERTDPRIFTEAVFTIFQLTNERIAEYWRHWSGLKAASGDFINVGFFYISGWRVYSTSEEQSNHYLCISICHKQRTGPVVEKE